MVKEEFKKEVKGLDNYIALVVVNAKNYQKTNIELVRYLVKDNNMPGVYVSLNKPFDVMERLLKKGGIDTRLIIFIDAVTKTVGGKTEKTTNCLFIGSPDKLSDISVAMDQAVRALPEKKFVFFDSLNTLTLFNKPGTVARFIHFLTSKMRVWKIKGVIISLEKESDESLLNELTPFCDVRLDVIGGR